VKGAEVKQSYRKGTFVRAAVRLLATVVVGSTFSAIAMAESLGTAYTDLWWNPKESGWGVTIAHQQNVMFLTFFVYRADGSPYWVVATLQNVGNSDLRTMPHVFSGDVYETHGPTFSVPFNSASVTEKKVGTATFTVPQYVNQGFLQYTINGISVTKAISRQTLSNVDFSGSYYLSAYYRTYNCLDPSYNGEQSDSGTFSIRQADNTPFAMGSMSEKLGSCRFDGSYKQYGSEGRVDGTYSCTDGMNGTFALDVMQWNWNGMTAKIAGKNRVCQFYGRIAGARHDGVIYISAVPSPSPQFGAIE